MEEIERAGEMVLELSLQTTRVQSQIEKVESPYAVQACQGSQRLRMSTQVDILECFG
jgi:hypothetical protein